MLTHLLAATPHPPSACDLSKSKNFFAALDDDDDDDVKPVVKQAPPKVQSVTKPVATEPIKEHR
jgi:hypothetical protein